MEAMDKFEEEFDRWLREKEIDWHRTCTAKERAILRQAFFAGAIFVLQQQVDKLEKEIKNAGN